VTEPRAHRHEELAEFLKSRRARLTPEDVGLAPTERRRTPGLRREEVAQLAGMSPTWYTWLEQGRDVTPSKQVVDCLADALRLTDVERRHLHALARGETGDASRPIGSGLVALVQGLDVPAYVRDHASNLIGWNTAATAMFGDFNRECGGWVNLLAYLFLSPRARAVYVDWEEVARGSVSQFRRHSAAPGSPEEEVRDLVDRLRDQSPDFVEMWDQFVVSEYYVGTRVLRHPAVGEITFNYATLASYDGGPPWVTLYTPSSRADVTSMRAVLELAEPGAESS
jgi:transcriptional regulator with XRE-family HTH domain